MTLALDTSTVSPVLTTSTTVNTSASFTAPANSRIWVACTTNRPQSGNIATSAISNTGTALTWTRRIIRSLSNGPGSAGTSAEMYEAWNASSQSITVSVTPDVGANSGSWELRVKIGIAT